MAMEYEERPGAAVAAARRLIDETWPKEDLTMAEETRATETASDPRLPAWLAKRVDVYQALKDRGLDFTEITFILDNRGEELGWPDVKKG